MRSTKARVMSAIVLLVGTLALNGLWAPSAAAAVDGDLVVSITNGPTDAGTGDLITGVPFDPAAAEGTQFVTVHVQVWDTDETETLFLRDAGVDEVEVNFRLAILADFDEGFDGQPPASGTPTVGVELTNADGNAIFDTSLSIAPPNEPLTSAYYLVPQARDAVLSEGWPFEGAPSAGFDIWGDACRGQGCDVFLRDGEDTYDAGVNAGMAASELTDDTHIMCKGQRQIFGQDLFFHVTTGASTDAVKLTSFITAADFRAAGTNFGQAHVDWCVGLETAAPWKALGVKPTTQTFGGLTWFVGLAPKCPSKKQMPPCILSRMSDGLGGAIVTGWLPGGDPPRRT